MLKSGLAISHSLHARDFAALPLAMSSTHLRGIRVPVRGDWDESSSMARQTSKSSSKKWRVLGVSSSDWVWVWNAVRAVQNAIDMGLHSNIVYCVSFAFAVVLFPCIVVVFYWHHGEELDF